MLPAALIGLIALIAIPLFPGDLPPAEAPTIPPVRLFARSASPGQPSGADAAASRLVNHAAEYLRGNHFDVTTDGSGGYLVALPKTKVAAGGTVEASSRPMVLSIGFNSSSLPAASGLETRFGGDADAAWRLAYQVQRNFAGGMRDVLGYESFDRGILEWTGVPTRGSALLSVDGDDPWVTAYPLFSTNPFEASLIESPGAIELLSIALANAVAAYADPDTGSPKRTVQAGWSRMPMWEPVEPRAIYGAEGSPKVAFTFDGGASSEPTPAILKALRGAGVRATMFMTADFVERNPELVVQMARDGHEFGNHSSTHPDMTTIADWEIIEELDRLEVAVKALTGKSTRPWFRPPFGAVNDRVLSVAAQQGYYAVMWTADSADWRTDIDSSTVASRLLRYSEPGAIMIEHLGSPQSADVLAGVLKQLAARGIAVGTLSEVVGAP